MSFECLAGDPAVLENMPADFAPMDNIGAKPVTCGADFSVATGMAGQSFTPGMKRVL